MIVALEFRSPSRLWLLVMVALLAGAYLLMQRRRRTYAVRFTNMALLDSVAPRRPGWRRHVPAALMLVALAALVGAIAEPVAAERVPQERATIVIAIDTSLSMEATDVAPNRLVAAQEAAKEFIDILPERLNVGLVSFNGVAQIKVPPTQDHDQLKAAIDQLRLGERTAIGEAIFASLDAVNSAPEAAEDEDPIPARIVLMSDGSTTVGRPDAQAAAAAKEAGVPVSTIAFGTPGGTITIEGEPEPIPVAVDSSALAEIANTTDGTFFEAATGEELNQVYEDIGSSIGYTTEDRDVSERFVGAGLVLLLASAVLSQLWFSRLP